MLSDCRAIRLGAGWPLWRPRALPTRACLVTVCRRPLPSRAALRGGFDRLRLHTLRPLSGPARAADPAPLWPLVAVGRPFPSRRVYAPVAARHPPRAGDSRGIQTSRRPLLVDPVVVATRQARAP